MMNRAQARALAALLTFTVVIASQLSAQDISTAEVDDADAWPTLEGEGINISSPVDPSHKENITLDPADASHAIDLSAALAEKAGLSLTSYGGYGMVSGLNVRGFSSARVRVYLDGIPLNSRQSGEADLSWIDPASLTEATVEYGSGAGGIIRLSTIDDAFRGSSWSIGASNLSWIPPHDPAGLADTQRVSLSATYGTDSLRWNAGLFGTRAANRFPYANASGETAYRDDNDVLDAGFRAGLSAPLSRDVSLAVALSGYLADKSVAGSTGSLTSGRQDDARLRESFRLSFRDGEKARYDAEIAFAHSFASIRWEDISGGTHNMAHTLDLAAHARRYASDTVTVAFSTEAAYVACNSDSIGDKRLATATMGIAIESRFPGRLSTRAELRAVAPSGGDGWAAIPTVSLFKGFGDDSRIGALAYRAYKRPDLNALYWSGDPSAQGNPNLKNEDGWGGEILAELSIRKKIRSSHSAYATWYRNAVSWQATSGVWTPENMGEALFAGTDHAVSISPFDGLTLELSYSFLRTWVLTGEFAFSDGKRIPYQPEHRASLTVRGSKKSWSWRVSPRYESARFVSVMNVASLPGFFVLDAGVQKRCGKNLEVSFEAKNVLSESYETVEGYPMPGASVSIGILYTYR